MWKGPNEDGIDSPGGVKGVTILTYCHDQLAGRIQGTNTGSYIDHDSLLSELVERKGSIDSTPIELDRASDTVDTASENENTVVIEGDIVRRGVVCSV